MSSTTHLVTGGAGFIGSHLVSALLARGDRVRVIDNLATGKLSNIAPVLNRVEMIRADISDFDSIREAFEGASVVFHQAAIPSVPRSVADPRLNHEANVNGTFNVLMAAREAGARRVVFASSSSVYGGTRTLPKREDMPPAPLSPYAAAKLAGEYYCRVFSESYGLETIALRYFNVFGPRQDPTSAYSGVISKFITALLRGERPVIFGDGEQTRDFTYIDNVIAANLHAAEVAGARGQVLNIGTGNRTSLEQLLAALQRIIGTSIEPEHKPARQAEPRDSQADISLARQLLGYEPLVSFEDGLKQTVDWYGQQTAEGAE